MLLTLADMSSCSPLPSTKVVSSLLDTTRRHLPRSAISIESKLLPVSPLITVAPKRIDISSSIAFLRSPNAGALIPKIFNVPLILFTTNVARAWPSISSAIITKSRPTAVNFSRKGIRSSAFSIFSDVIRT